MIDPELIESRRALIDQLLSVREKQDPAALADRAADHRGSDRGLACRRWRNQQYTLFPFSQ
jgi:hypothetical protein